MDESRDQRRKVWGDPGTRGGRVGWMQGPEEEVGESRDHRKRWVNPGTSRRGLGWIKGPEEEMGEATIVKGGWIHPKIWKYVDGSWDQRGVRWIPGLARELDGSKEQRGI